MRGTPCVWEKQGHLLATIYDLYEVTSISENTTYSQAAGNLLGVIDGVNGADLNDGEFDEGDTILIGGVSYSIDWIQEPSSSGRFTLGDGTDVSFNPQSESNLDVIFLTVSNGSDVRHFIIPNDSYGDMNIQSIRTGSLNDVGGSDAALVSTRDNQTQVVCFVTGTLIETPAGDVPVEDININDYVLTCHNGPQRVRAILVRDLDLTSGPDRFKPIAFEADAFAPGCPSQRLCVSPQHRMLVTGTAGQPVLVPAKALVGRKGVRVMRGKRKVTYHHLVFSRHEIIRANGALTESFYPGPMAVHGIPDDTMGELGAIFGADLGECIGRAMRPAAPILSCKDAQRTDLTFH